MNDLKDRLMWFWNSCGGDFYRRWTGQTPCNSGEKAGNDLRRGEPVTTHGGHKPSMPLGRSHDPGPVDWFPDRPAGFAKHTPRQVGQIEKLCAEMVLTEIKEPGEYAHLIAAEYFDGIKAHVDEIAGKMYVQRPLLLKRDNLPPGTMGIRVIRSLAGLYREEPQHTNHQPIAPHAPELSAVDGIRGG